MVSFLRTNYRITGKYLDDNIISIANLRDAIVSTSALAASGIQESHITSWAIIPGKLRLDADGSQTVMQSIGFLLSRAAVCDAEGLLTVSMDGFGRPLWVQGVLASTPGSAALASNIPVANIYLTMNSAAEGPISGSIAYLKFMAIWNYDVGSAASFIRTASFGSMAAATVRCVYWGLIGSR